jgi:hypothetical protein
MRDDDVFEHVIDSVAHVFLACCALDFRLKEKTFPRKNARNENRLLFSIRKNGKKLTVSRRPKREDHSRFCVFTNDGKY